jgi:hypothetical protein
MSRLATSLLFVFLLAASAQAAFVKQPYLQNLAAGSVVVRFETATPLTGKVQFGLTASYGSEATDAAPGVDHEIALPSLSPDTVYHYRAIAGADTSPDRTFRSMASVSRPFRFMAYGDNRSDSAAHQSVVDRMVAVNPPSAIAVNVGDLTYAGGSAQYQTFFNVEAGLAGKTALFPAIGNHDDDTMANWYRYFALPGNERWYRFRYGNSSFISLNVYETYTSGSAQYDTLLSWLLADSADPNVRHTFVFFHDPPYTTNAGHAPNLTVRTNLCPLFERFGVRIAFQGHVHAYEHSLVNGVHHLITGGGGAPLHVNWNAPEPGTVYREATYEFTLVDVRGDTISCRSIRPNGTVFDSFQLVPPRHDVGCTRIIAPAGSVDSGQSVTPACSLYNYGNQAETYAVRMKVGAYDQVATVTGHAPGTAVHVTFPNWTASPVGTLAVSCSTELGGDRVAANNKATGTVTVQRPGGPPPGAWTIKKPVPDLPSGRQLKDGAWLVAAGGLIYAAKGNKQADFYSYNPANDSWKTLAPWPVGIEGKGPSKGSVGAVGADDKIYATKGNNTPAFWMYDIGTNTWYPKAAVPLGLSNKKVKGGTDIVFAKRQNPRDGFLYLLKGYKDEFYRYDAGRDSWRTMTPAPTGSNLKWDKGSWLAYRRSPGRNEYAIYAHKAKYHEFYKYDVVTDSWRSPALTAMPLVGSGGARKAKDGSCGVAVGDYIYAFKGANTIEFWRYDVALNSWVEKETIPSIAPGTTRKKKVKGGGDLVESGDLLYAIKGNKTNEFWMYTPGAFGPEARRPDGVVSSSSIAHRPSFIVSPNPLAAGFATLRFTRPLESSSPQILLSVFDAAGRCVGVWKPLLRNGAADLDVQRLAAGVYLVKVEADGFAASQKLAVQR